MKKRSVTLAALSLFSFLALACKPPDRAANSKVRPAETAKKAALQAQAKAPKTQARPKPAPAKKGGDWNLEGIDWQGFDQGLKLAAAQHKPICLIFSTEWCPHCRRYSGVFHDAQVVEMSKNFVMIHLDKDKNRELSKRFSPDGEYIPRTYFLNSQGQLDEGLHVNRPKYKYFYDEKNPQSLLAGMQAALKKLK